MFYYKNWLQHSFDGVMHHVKQSPRSKMKLHLNPYKVQKLNLQDSLYHNAVILEAFYPPPYDVCLSGGIDSEMIVRVNHDLKIKQNVYTFEFEDDLNIRDVICAKSLCDTLGIKLKIIPFNVKKFIENELGYYYQKTFIPKFAYIIRLKWLDYLYNTPVFGDGEPYYTKVNDTEWVYEIKEHEFSLSLWQHQSHRDIIGEWYLFTAEIAMNYNKNHIIQKLINNQLVGKTSSWSSRYSMFQQYWPDVKNNIKLVGYEGANGDAGYYPSYIEELNNTLFKQSTNQYFRITQQDIENFYY